MMKEMFAARAAAPGWRALPVRDRMQPIRFVRQLLVRDLDEWIALLGQEAGKTPMDALTTDLLTVIQAIAYYEKNTAKLLRSRRVRTPLWLAGSSSHIAYEPCGVAAIIAPWNFPLQLTLIPALAAAAVGNTVLLKPSEKLPLLSKRIAALIEEAAFPPGVLQLVEGGQAEAERLIDARPDKLWFTGSEAAGRSVLARAGAQLIPCVLELGGKDPMIVCADAHIERAARAAVWGAFLHSGQVCISVERVYVHESIYAAFLAAVVAYTRELRQAEGGSWSEIGALATEEGWHKVKRLLDDAVAKGASIAAGGLPPGAEPPLFPPTVLTGVTEEMQLMQEEIFGPLLPIMAFQSEDEVIRLANASPYGLSASIFTANRKKGLALAARLETGSCSINDVVRHIGNMHLPFGGVKASGFGRAHGEEGLLAFCRSKSVMVNAGRSSSQINWFPYREQAFSGLKQAIGYMYGRRRGRR
ncbi:aldehyde dehydrogenase family protein [Paenibacillus sp. BIHB 4019]|nr:aldehyde dehydrogenase family protein [Paenibacillus sp. BIHB 4019]